MADDLIIKYFTQDLTEAEESALAERLRSSTEEAQRFGQHAETAYRHYGLPEPQWPGAPPPPGFGPSGLSLKLGLFLAATVGVLGWSLWAWVAPGRTAFNANAKPAALPETSTAVHPQAPARKVPAVSDTVGQERAHSPENQAVEERVAPASDPSQAVDRVPSGSSRSQAAPVLTPLAAGPQHHSAHPNLEVVVRRKTPGPLTVEVLDPQGARTVLLYQGTLQPGAWAFDWDGKLGDGSPAVPGTYRIQVESGAVTQSKRVVIRK